MSTTYRWTAKVTATPVPSAPRRCLCWARGRVFKVGRTWCYEVSGNDGRVYLSDNTGSWRPMLEACIKDTAALDRILGAGHKLKHTYAELVNRAVNR